MSRIVLRRFDFVIALVLPALFAGCGGGSTISPDPDGGSTTSTGSTSGDGGSGGVGGTGGTASSNSSSTASASGTGGSGGTAPLVWKDSYPLEAQYPEGGTYDPAGHAFYVGSLGDGSVHRVDAATGAETVLFTETAPGTWWTLGMDVDVTRRRLWVCAMDDRSPDPRAGYIWIFDLETGKRLRNHALSAAATDATCTDVALTKDGRGYVGDREAGNLYRVDIDAGASLFVSDPGLSAAFVGQNSTVVLPDESALLTVTYGLPHLVRVDLATKAVKEVDIDGTFSDFSPLAGADGMTLAGGSAYVAFTSKLIKVTPTLGDWSKATSVAVDVPSGMTDVVSTPNGLYLLNGQSVRFALGTTPDPFALVRFVGDLSIIRARGPARRSYSASLTYGWIASVGWVRPGTYSTSIRSSSSRTSAMAWASASPRSELVATAAHRQGRAGEARAIELDHERPGHAARGSQLVHAEVGEGEAAPAEGRRLGAGEPPGVGLGRRLGEDQGGLVIPRGFDATREGAHGENLDPCSGPCPAG
ncbi:MAG: SMP-30/gluconolactonase/LRE family protein [Minicystis sp.]